MEEITRICAVAILGATALTLLKNWKNEFVLPLRSLTVVLLLSMALGRLRPLLAEIGEIAGILRGENVTVAYTDRMCDALGVALLSTICGGICRDAGEGTLADGIGTAAKLELLLLCLPLIRQVAETIGKLWTL